ncbi:MAG: putative protein-disulfide isomerase [Candidatus Endobugula sp.]|jgi:putative protein-disulfide isomerase
MKEPSETIAISNSAFNPISSPAVEYTLYYLHDPMCSWCWGFRPTWNALRELLTKVYPQITIQYVLGGLAPDSDEPMPLAMQEMLATTWRRIPQVVPSAIFNHDFWRICHPRRSTYLSCRGVIAATQQSAASEEPMILAIQQAYYLHAQNPSDTETLINCAGSIGLNVDRFERDLNSPDTEQLLQNNIEHYRQLALQSGVSGFPGLVLGLAVLDNQEAKHRYYGIDIDYCHPNSILAAIAERLSL